MIKINHTQSCRRFIRSSGIGIVMLVLGILWLSQGNAAAGEIIDLGQRRELFVDRFLIDSMNNVELRLHEPQLQPAVNAPPAAGSYCTILQDQKRYLLYYRGTLQKGDTDKTTQFAYYIMLSDDGIHWQKPKLNLFPAWGPAHCNMIMEPRDPYTHNFSPFIDTRPDVPDEERFKATAGGGKTWSTGEGLYGFVSPDGIHWQLVQEQPIVPEGHDSEHYFDSQNPAFWSESEKCYVCYYRTWLPKVPGKRGIRSISRSTSKDFLHWTQGVQLPVNLPDEQLYTNQTSPYFRAPHIYVALALRYLPWSGGDIHKYPSDTVLMTARGPAGYDRTFREAFIRPGSDPRKWDRSNPVSTSATLNVIPTGDDEISIYVRDQRYTLRTDGFASLHADMEWGQMRTKPFTFVGSSLEINYSTSAAGRLLVEICDAEGRAIPGYTFEDCPVIVGDEISHIVQWDIGSDLSAVAGKPIRLLFKLCDADLFALRFK